MMYPYCSDRESPDFDTVLIKSFTKVIIKLRTTKFDVPLKVHNVVTSDRLGQWS